MHKKFYNAIILHKELTNAVIEIMPSLASMDIDLEKSKTKFKYTKAKPYRG